VVGGVSWAFADVAAATNINVAVSIDLMTNPWLYPLTPA